MILTGCSSSYKELNKNTYTSQDPFITTIIEEYKVNADFEANKMHDWNSVKLYSKKAPIFFKRLYLVELSSN